MRCLQFWFEIQQFSLRMFRRMGHTALFSAGLLKVNRIFRSAPSSHFRCMSNEAFQLYFFGKLSLPFAYLSENPEFLIIWKFKKKKLKKN